MVVIKIDLISVNTIRLFSYTCPRAKHFSGFKNQSPAALVVATGKVYGVLCWIWVHYINKRNLRSI